MTCREKLEKMNPGCKVHDIIDEVCPSDLGYLPDPDWCNCDCELCWDREIPETEDLCSNCVNLGLACNADDGNKVCPHVSHPFSEKITECAYCELVKNESKTVDSYTTHTGDIDKCFDCAFCTILVPEAKTAGNEKFCHHFDKKIIGNVIQCTDHVPEELEGASAAIKALMSKYSGAIPRVEAADEETAIRYTGAVKNIRELEELGLKDISSESLAYGKIKDSGARIQFETGAVTDSHDGKGRCDLMPLDVVAGFRGQILNDIHDYQTSGDHKHLKIALQKFIDKYMKDMSTALLEVSIHFEEGAKKYGEHNWQKGIPTHRHIDSAVRHYLKFMRGDKDEPHDRAFIWRLLCCIWTCIHKPELNDYHPNNQPKSEMKKGG